METRSPSIDSSLRHRSSPQLLVYLLLVTFLPITKLTLSYKEDRTDPQVRHARNRPSSLWNRRKLDDRIPLYLGTNRVQMAQGIRGSRDQQSKEENPKGTCLRGGTGYGRLPDTPGGHQSGNLWKLPHSGTTQTGIYSRLSLQNRSGSAGEGPTESIHHRMAPWGSRTYRVIPEIRNHGF